MIQLKSVLNIPALFSVHIATFLFGLAGVLGAVIGLNAIEVTFGRTLFASVALLVVWYLTSRPSVSVKDGVTTKHPAKKPGITWLAIFSGVMLAFHWVTFFAGIQLSTVAIGLVTFSICPVFVALLEPFYFREKFKASALVAALVVLIGVVIISGVYRGELVYPAGIACGIASGFSFAVLQLVNRKLAKTAVPVAISMVQNVVATVVLLPIVAGGLADIQSGQWLLLIFLGIGCTALAHTLFINALKQVKVATASLIVAGLEPVYGIALAAFFLTQWPTPEVVLGGIIILATVIVVTYRQATDKANA